MQTAELLQAVKAISRQAGQAIMAVYEREGRIEVSSKADDSPLTEADLVAHEIIVAGLQKLEPSLPVLSEESAGIGWQERRHWQRYWLVDPLDGTREFVKRNGEFTVNIALIDRHQPVLGVVYAPVLDVLYAGAEGFGASRETNGEGGLQARQIRVRALQAESGRVSVVASRSHRGPALESWLTRLQQRFHEVEQLSMGSSLKICLVAEGRADIYPRLGPTSEWDTAAAQAVLEAAGGVLVDAEFRPYCYNLKEDMLNPWFFAIGDRTYPWQGV